MFRFLIVEDDKETVKVLRRLLKLNFTSDLPDIGESQIDIASTVADAMQFLKNARKPYHVAILDFKLPAEHIAGSAKVDETVCLQAMRHLRPPIIVHITSNPNDDPVKTHIRNLHTEHSNRYDFALSKLDSDWTEKLLVELKKVLYSRPIAEQLDQMFGGETQRRVPGVFIAAGRSRGQRCLTQELAELSREIVAHWDDLDEQLQRRIESYFDLKKDSRPIKISLL